MKNLQNTLRKLKFMIREGYSHLKKAIKNASLEYQKKVSWSSFAAMLAAIVTLETYRSIGSAMAVYQGREGIYIISYLFTVIISIIAIWEFFCLTASLHMGSIWRTVCRRVKLWQYFKKSSYKLKWGLLSIIIALMIIVPVAWKYLYYDKCITEYYASVVEVYGIPNGVGDPLSVEERGRRAGYWRIEEYPNQRKIILTYVDGYQHMEIMRQYSSAYHMQVFQTPARIVYNYTSNPDKFRSYSQDSFMVAKENGYREVLKVSYYGDNGKLLLELAKNDDDTFRVERYSSEDAPQLLNSTLLRIPEGQTAENSLSSQQINVTYNSEGLPAMRRLDQSTCNLYGINGERYTYDRDRHLASLCYLDVNGEPVCNKTGIMLITFKYDHSGNLASIRYYSDEDGTEKTEGFYGVFCEKFFYDSSNNLTERRQLDRTENWSYDENGVYKYEYIYDSNTLREEFYWGLNEISASSKLSNSHSLRFEQGQENGREVLSVSFDVSASPVRTADSARVVAVTSGTNMQPGDSTVWDEISDVQENDRGNIFSRYVGADNSIDRQNSSVRGTGSATNGQGSRINGNSISGTDNGVDDFTGGQTGMENTWTSRAYTSIEYVFGNKWLEMKYCDSNGQLVENGQGYAVKKVDYDDEMRIILESYASTDGEPCYLQGGYAAVRKIYKAGDENRVAWVQYLDIKGNITYNTEAGYACVEYNYTPQDRGEKITQIYYDANNNLCCILDKGYAIIEKLYNENGFLIQKLYKNAEGAVTCRRDYMVAEILYEYADDGNLIREHYKNAEGQPINRADTGYAVVYREYVSGRLVREYYEGYEDKVLRAVADRTTGIAAITYSYDRGEKQKEQYYDIEGNLALRRDIGCAAIQYEYNNNGQLLGKYYYGTDDRLILRKDTGSAIDRFGYDKEGRRVSYRYYGVDEEPVVNTKYNCAGMDYVYDERGNRSEILYIGLDGCSLMDRDDCGIAKVCQEYDGFGNLSGESYYDEEGHLAIRKDCGYASYKDIYEKGNLIEERYLDTEGRLILCKDGGYAIKSYEYNDCRQLLSVCFLGQNGEPIISRKYHCARIDYQYDEKGHMTGIYYKGLDGSLINRTDYGIAEIFRTYDEWGNLIKESYYDKEGLPAIRKEYGYASCINTYTDGYKVESRYYDTDNELVSRKDKGFAIISFEYDGYGQVLAERYYDMNEEPVIHATIHCAGLDYGYDRMGNKTEVRYVGPEGELMNRRDCGVAKVCNEYDGLGNLIGRQYFDTEGQPAVWREYGYASCRYTYEDGFLVESQYFDVDKTPVLRKDVGYSVMRSEYDQYGRKISDNFYDASGAPVISSKYHCAGMSYVYDRKGNQEKVCYLGLNGEAFNRDDFGFAAVCKTYDQVGNLTGESYYDAEGNPAIRKEYGYASYSSIYENGKKVENQYYNTNGELILRKDKGYAIDRSSYDAYGREISWRFYGTDGNPIISPQYYCAGFGYGYNEKSNQTETSYLGLDGGLMNRGDCGVAKVYKEYDQFGNLIEESYYNVDNDPAVWIGYGYASYRNKYESGKWVESQYFDLDKKLILRKDVGYAIIKLAYDRFGQRIAEHYYGIDGQPVLDADNHCAGIGNKYDDKGNKIEICYWGLDGELINTRGSGIAKICREYDSAGRLVSESYYNAEEHPTIATDYGYFSYRYIYANGKISETQFLDTENCLVLNRDAGRAVIQYQYDEAGREKIFLYYDTSKKPVISTRYHCAGMEYTYDDKGNRIGIQYIGLDGSPMNREDYGIAQIVDKYDEYGNLYEESYYDAEGHLSLRNNYGYAVCEMEYENGRKTEARYLDTYGNLVLRQDTGYAMVRYGYNEYGQKVWEQYYGTDETPIISAIYHCAGYYYNYDDRGKRTMTWYMGLDGQVMTREDLEVDLEFWAYDEYGSLIRDAYFTYSDKEYHLAVPKGYDYAGMDYTYDEDGNWISKRYFDAEGKNVICSETGYAIYERRYNDRGQIVAEIYYDENKEYINSVNGYAMIEYIYDVSGNSVDFKYYDQSEAAVKLESM